MNKCFDSLGNKLTCPPRVILPIRNLAPNNINKSKAMRRAMKIRNYKSYKSGPTSNINLQKFQNEFNSTSSIPTFTNGKFCPTGPFWSYWINKS